MVSKARANKPGSENNFDRDGVIPGQISKNFCSGAVLSNVFRTSASLSVFFRKSHWYYFAYSFTFDMFWAFATNFECGYCGNKPDIGQWLGYYRYNEIISGN